MKNIYLTCMVLSFALLSSCSKDFLKSYSKRIIGTWRITSIDKIGIGGNTSTLAFRNGTFVFRDDGTVDYTESGGPLYKGTWRIEKKPANDDDTYRSLHITVVDYVSQRALSQYYDDMNFAGTDHFKARVLSTFQTYVTHFKR